MRGDDKQLSIGQRIGYFRRRRGMSQEVLASLVGRTANWLGKVENGHIPLDRVSVIASLAQQLDVSLKDLLPDDIAPVDSETRGRSVPQLRKAVASYRTLTPLLDFDAAPGQDLSRLKSAVADVWSAYQDSRFGYVVARIVDLMPTAYAATRQLDGEAQREAFAQFAYLHQVAAGTLTKLGEVDLALLCADRGLTAAERSETEVPLVSLLRSVAHSLLANAQFDDAVAVVDQTMTRFDALVDGDGDEKSVYGTMLLVGALASARGDNGHAAREYLRHAGDVARALGHDGNYVWSSFGPTNVAVHEVSIAMELGDDALAAELGPQVDVSVLPRERQIRHHLEVARAHHRTGNRDETFRALLTAEQEAPEQVRRHFLTHELVLAAVRDQRRPVTAELHGLATRVGVL